MKFFPIFFLCVFPSAVFSTSEVPNPKEIVLKVKAKRRKVQDSASTSNTQISKEDIQELPQGDQIKLPKLISTTTPGVVSGAFGQLFFRGNHANIQYQIDGVQLPESPSGTFGEAFTPRNIDHMEIITGGIPAEFGQRLSAVVNIISKTGPEDLGGSGELNYGSYNFFSPTATAGGSTQSGDLHYYISGNFNRTDRALDTPQPIGTADVTQGSPESIHNMSSGHNEFVKLDWIANNTNKFTFIVFNNSNALQIPNYPSSFKPTDSIFTSGDAYGNGPYFYRPAATDDTQNEMNTYGQAVWKHTFNERSFLQVAPYWKYSYIGAQNDPTNDLAGATLVPGPTNTYSSFALSRNVNNYGIKTDYTLRPSESHLLKTGFQVQASNARGSFSIVTANPAGTFSDSTPNDGYLEGVYVQDDYTIIKPLILNAGMRFDAIQLNLGPNTNPTDYALQPRVGLNYLLTASTNLHLFYGKLFQPAPVENLRSAFTAIGGGALAPYDIKAEKADYYEVGIAQELPFDNVVSVTAYQKNAQNLLDDAQLLNTAIAQPINFATGFVYGTELSLRGQFLPELTHYLNYSYSIAQGKGLSGGIFVFPPGKGPGPNYQYLDHAQIHTLNSGVTFKKKQYWLTAQAQFGSGLRTDPNNATSLPAHLTFDTTIGYEFHGKDWWDSGLKVSLDVLNITDNIYPISVANGFNGSHYAAGRQFFVHLVKEI